jgi:pimeloyl-ACP methyl ester carboxylesterase
MGVRRKARTLDGIDIAFEIDGRGDPIVLLHGITENRESWRTIAEMLSGDYQVIRIDLRGHGDSAFGRDYHPRVLASDVAAVLREIEIDSAHLVGHSLGGATATFVAAMYGARSVTNVDQPMNFDALAPLLCPIEPALRGPQFVETLQTILGSLEGDRLSTSVRQELLAYHQNARKDVVLGCWNFIFNQSPQALAEMADEVLGSVRAPYWSIYGTDPGPQYELWLKQRIPSAVIEIWPGAGHWLHRVDPERFNAGLRQWLNAH